MAKLIFYFTARPTIGAVVQERLVIEDPDQQKRIVSSIHDTSHMGLNRTTDMVSGKYYWPGLTAAVKAYVSSHDTLYELYLLVLVAMIVIFFFFFLHLNR